MVLVFSVADRATFEDLELWWKRAGSGAKTVVVVGNQADKRSSTSSAPRSVSKAEGQRWAEDHDAQVV